MPKDTLPTDRYRRIHDIFSRRRGQRSVVRLQDLAGQVGISLRQLNDDIKYMRDQGAPLEYVPALRGWRYKEGHDFIVLEDQLLNDEDVKSLRIAMETFNRINNGSKALGDLPEVFRRIYKASRKWTQPDSYQKAIYFDPLPHYEGAKHLTFFLKAIEESRRVEFHYLAFHADQPKIVVFDPWFLRHYDRRWYVGGFSHDPEEQFVRVFPLERIEDGPQVIGYCHDKPRDYDAGDYWKYIYGISVPKDGQIEPVVLAFTALQGKYFRSSPFFEPYAILESNAAQLVVRLEIIVNNELVQKLASYGKDVQVRAPEHLVRAMKRFLEAAREGYGVE